MVNPKYKMILNQFVKHLEQRDSLLGWLIISKESYQYSIFR